MDNLVLLKRIACDYSVLVVEDSRHIILKLKEFLKKFFVEIDLAYNGLEGLEKVNEKNYDIVITDINMPKLDGNDFIQELVQISPDTQIIVVSAFGYDENVVKLNKFGITDFIQKPINNIKLVDSLVNSIDNIKLSKSDDKEITLSINNELYEKIQEHKKTNTPIELINFYKGVSINQRGLIKAITKNAITIKTTNSQYYLIKCEKRTVLIIGDIVLRTDLHFEDKTNEELIFKKFELLNRSPKDRAATRVAPDRLFTVSRLYKGESLAYGVIAVSVNSISVRTTNQDETLLQNDIFDIVFSFYIKVKTIHQVNQEKHIRIKTKAHILRIEELNDGSRKIVFLLNLEENKKQYLEEYTLQRETDILSELQSISNND